MIRAKLTKLAKRLKEFTLEDFLVMADEDEKTVKSFLDDLVDTDKLNKNNDSYVFKEMGYNFKHKETNTEEIIRKKLFFSKDDLKKLDKERETLESFKTAPKSVKKMINKYVDLLKEVPNTNGRVLDNYIKDVWNKQHPDYLTTKVSFLKAKRSLHRYGVAGLIAPSRNFLTTNHQLDEDLYKNFRSYLLENRAKGLKYNYLQFRAAYLKENTDEELWEFPSYNTFVTRMKNEIFKFNDSELANFFNPRKKVKIIQKKTGFKTFQPAAEDFLKDIIDRNELKTDSIKYYKAHINLHLIPFFQNIKLEHIDEDKLTEYKTLLEERQFSLDNIKSHMHLVKKILDIYLDDRCSTYESRKISLELSNTPNILSEKQILHLLSTCKLEFPDFYPLFVTAINTGLTRGEILALTWDKVDLRNRRIKITKSICNGKVMLIRALHAVRTVDLPCEIVEILKVLKKKSKSKYVFPDNNGEFQNPDEMIINNFNPLLEKAGLKNIRFVDLRDTYTAILIEKNFPLSYVKEQVGCSNLNTMATRFKQYIPHKKKDFCLI
jgi:integrase